jgi:hypothetical protein
MTAFFAFCAGLLLAPPGDPPAPDLKIAVWYREADPLDTFRYQVYDLRRGEYSPAVDQWSADVRARYPAYRVYVRDVVLARQRGASEKYRIGAAIMDEFLAVGAAHGYDFRPPAPTPATRSVATPRPSLPVGGLPPVGGPPAPSFPVPVPYPRPHP